MTDEILASLPDRVVLLAFAAAVAAFLALTGIAMALATRHRQRFEAAIGRSMRNAFLFVDPGSLHRLSIVSAVLLTLAGWTLSGNPIVAIAAALAAGALPGWMIARLRRRHVQAFRQQVPDLLMLVSGALRAGNGLGQALSGAASEIAAPARQEIGLMLREQRLGATLAESLAGLQRRVRVEETALFASAIQIGSDSGGNVADALESLADATRRKLALEGKIRALTAQGRLQAWVMTLLPAGLAGLLAAFDPESMRPLIADWRGWIVCGGVALMQVAGFLTIRRMVAIEI